MTALQTPAPTPKVFSYRRWSKSSQEEGDSPRRQTDAARQYAIAEGMELDESFTDPGVSAFRGANALADNALGRFFSYVATGEIAAGSVLVLEALDRMSRQAPRKAASMLLNLVNAGITVVTTKDSKVYTAAAMDDAPLEMFLTSVLHFVTAHQESANKSRRVKEAMEAKRARARATGEAFTPRAPAWLDLVSKEAGEWRVIEERAEVVRRIYREALTKGAPMIARGLNADAVPTFRGPTERTLAAGGSARWHTGVVLRILRSKAPAGVYVPSTTSFEGTRRILTPEEPIPNYWPAIVDADTFAAVHAMRLDSAPSMRGRNAGHAVRNVLGSLLRCERCGASVHRDSKGARSHVYVTCSSVKDGAGCDVRALTRYDLLERSLLSELPSVLEHAPTTGDSVRFELLELEDAIANLLDAEEELRAELVRGRSHGITQQLAALARERDAKERERAELTERAMVTAGPFVLRRVEELRAAIAAPELDRGRVNGLLRQLLLEARLDPDAGTLRLLWKGEAKGTAGESVTVKLLPPVRRRRTRAPRATAGAA